MTTTVLPAVEKSASRSRARVVAVALGAVAAALAVAYAADVALARDRVPRGLSIAGVDVGGRKVADAKRMLAAEVGPKAAAPVVVDVDGTPVNVDPGAAGLSVDLDATVERARRQALNPWTRLRSFFADDSGELVVDVDEVKLRAALDGVKKRVDRPAREGSVRFDGVTPVGVPPQSGRVLDAEGAAEAVRDAYPVLDGARVDAPVEVTPVRSTAEGVRRAVAEIAEPAVSAPVLLTGPNGVRVQLRPADVAATLRIAAGPTGEMVATVDAAALEKVLDGRLGAAEAAPKDASFVIAGTAVTIVPSQAGREVDMAALARGLVPVLAQPEDRAYPLPIRDAQPKLTTEKARALGIKEPIGSGTTFHPCCRPRVRNIHRMADIVDGALVLPGETFSLNGYVGPRDRKRGFVEAPMILNGDFVDSVGGGVSQFATTMFNAVFFSGMQDVYHKAHSYYISRYPAGREATVSFPNPDLKWRNDSPYGVLVKTSYTDTSITVTFWGTKRYDAIESVSGPRTRVRGSYTKYKYGPGCESHKGGPGFDIVVTRLFKKGGQVVKTEKFFTRYLVDPTIVCRRSRPASSSSPAPAPAAQPSPAPSG